VLNINASYNNLNFLAFQLNTLDIDSPNGVKNIVWSNTNSRFFKRIKSQPWKHPEHTYVPSKYDHFHPAAFEKFLAMYLYNYDKKRPVCKPMPVVDEVEQ